MIKISPAMLADVAYASPSAVRFRSTSRLTRLSGWVYAATSSAAVGSETLRPLRVVSLHQRCCLSLDILVKNETMSAGVWRPVHPKKLAAPSF